MGPPSYRGADKSLARQGRKDVPKWCVAFDTLHQCFLTTVRPRPGKFFLHKTRARSQKIYLPPGKTRYPLYWRLGGPQCRSGRAENLAPTGIRSPDRPARSQSLYLLSYPAHFFHWPVNLKLLLIDLTRVWTLLNTVKPTRIVSTQPTFRSEIAEELSVWHRAL